MSGETVEVAGTLVMYVADPSWDSQRRISVLTSRLADLRKAYHSVKAELAAIDRRRKKLRRKEREGAFAKAKVNKHRCIL